MNYLGTKKRFPRESRGRSTIRGRVDKISLGEEGLGGGCRLFKEGWAEWAEVEGLKEAVEKSSDVNLKMLGFKTS